SAVEESESLFDTLAQAVHEFTGFERALVYELDGDGCATIVSESADMGLPSVLGGKIPGHEFPPDLERLYELNPTRFIADTHISPVPLNASNHPLSRRPLD